MTILRQRIALALVLVLVVSGVAGCGAAEVASPQEGHAAPRQTNVSSDELRRTVDWLAASERLGRLAGTAEARATADWLVNRFGELGLSPTVAGGYRQEFSFSRLRAVAPVRLAPSGIAQSHPYVYRADYRLEPITAAGALKAGVVFAGYGLSGPERNDYQGGNVRGKVVLIIRDCPATVAAERASVATRVAEAARRGAVGVLLIDGGETLDWTAGIHPATKLPVLTIGPAVAADLLAGSGFDLGSVIQQVEQQPVQLETLRGQVDLAVSLEHQAGLKGANVVGYLPGTDPSAGYFIVGGHYDHLGVDVDGATYPGGYDNASGVAVMLEVARVLALDHPGPGILFVAWDAEEEGLIGSSIMANALPLPARNLIGVINVDTLGDSSGSWLIRHNEAAAGLATSLASEATELGLAVAKAAATGGSDEQSFVRAGLPALRLTDARPPESMHATSEDVRTVDAAQLAKAAQAIIAVIDGWESGSGSTAATTGTETGKTGTTAWQPAFAPVGADGRVELQTAEFTFRFKPGLKVSGDPAAEAAKIYAAFSDRLGCAPEGPLTVILTNDRADQVATVRSVYPHAVEPITDAWVHYPSRTIVVRASGTGQEVALAMAHETAHLFIAAALPRVISSPWVGEYLATYLERRVAGAELGRTDWATKDDYARRLALIRVQTWADLSGSGSATESSVEAGSVYFFLEDTYGADRLTTLWQKLLKGADFSRTLREVYRKDAATLESEWRTYYGLK